MLNAESDERLPCLLPNANHKRIKSQKTSKSQKTFEKARKERSDMNSSDGDKDLSVHSSACSSNNSPTSSSNLSSRETENRSARASKRASKRAYRFDFWAFVPAFGICAFCLYGEYVHRVMFSQNIKDNLSNSSVFAVGACILCAAATAILYFLFSFLFRKADSALDSAAVPGLTSASGSALISDSAAASNSNSVSDSKPFLAYAFAKGTFFKPCAIMLVCWLPYMIFRFPGNLDPDTFWQLLQMHGLAELSDHHPFFDTLLFGAFWKIGAILGSYVWSLFLYSLFQMTLTAASLTLCLRFMSYIGTPAKIIKISRIFCCAFPVIPVFAQTMAKDSIFAVPWVFALIFFMETVRSYGKSLEDKKFAAAFFAALCFVMLTKRTGFYVLLLSCAALFCFIKCFRARFAAIFLASAILIFGLWQHAVLPAVHVEPGTETDMFSISSQSTALYISRYGSEMTEEEWQIIRGVYKEADILAEVYAPQRSDSTKDRWRTDASKEEKSAFFKWYATAMTGHPDAFFMALSANALPLYYSDKDTEGDESAIYYRNNLPSRDNAQSSDEGFLVSVSKSGTTREDVQKMTQSAYRLPIAAKIAQGFDTVYLFLAEKTPLLFSKAFYATWLPTVCLAFCIRRRNLGGIVCLIPAFVTLATLIAGPIVLPRYMVPVVYAAPLCVAACFVSVGKKSAGGCFAKDYAKNFAKNKDFLKDSTEN